MFVEDLPRIAEDEHKPPVRIENPSSESPLLLLCDHSGHALPEQVGQLGLHHSVFSRHVAWDIGAMEVAKLLREQFQCALVSGVYSRLLIDLNRFPDHYSWIPEVSDGIEITGNQNLSMAERKYRADTYFWPYHSAVERAVSRISTRGQVPIVISVHSFTSSLMDGRQRPWHFGILWNEDRRLSDPLMRTLRGNPAICVGDNEPYHAGDPCGYTVKTHAEDRGHPHVLIEIRQDLIDSEVGVAKWSGILGEALQTVLNDEGYFQLAG